MDPTIAGLIGTGIGAIVGLLGSFLSNVYLVRKEREKWIQDQKAEHQKWTRDQLQEIYANCIQHLSLLTYKGSELTPIQGITLLSKDEEIAWYSNYREAQKWLGLLLIYYPSNAGLSMSGFKDEVENFFESVDESRKKKSSEFVRESMDGFSSQALAESLRNRIIETARYDKRIQGDRE